MKKIVLNEQDFTLLREDDGLYVDKTERIFECIKYSRYLFLSRPRRFGKSLLISTLQALFSGKKELFKGLWIEDKWDWEEYPVIRLDFSDFEAGYSLEDLDASFIATLQDYAELYGLRLLGKRAPSLFKSLLLKIYRKTGKRVVILIDEYDNPITSHLSDVKKAERNRAYFRDIYQTIKARSGIIHFVLITGISKFAKMSIFSAISQMKDISLLPQFNDIVGFTEEELKSNFSEHLQAFGAANNMTFKKVMEQITRWYDGYTWDGVQHIYNPYAILNALADKMLDTYWFETGTPTFLIQLVTQHPPFKDANAPFLQQLDNLIATKETFDSYDLEDIDIKAALFQSGYLTIKEIVQDDHLQSYQLGFPNYEVRHAFNAHLLKAFTRKNIANEIKGHAVFMRKALRGRNKDKFQELITGVFAGIPSSNLKRINEFGYQAMFYQLLLLLGINDIFLEVSGYIGRADGVLLLDNKIFVFEFKFARQGTMKYLLDKAADQAQVQGYWHPYLGTEKEIYRVEVGFLYKKVGKTEKEVLTIDSSWERITSKDG